MGSAREPGWVTHLPVSMRTGKFWSFSEIFVKYLRSWSFLKSPEEVMDDLLPKEKDSSRGVRTPWILIAFDCVARSNKSGTWSSDSAERYFMSFQRNS